MACSIKPPNKDINIPTMAKKWEVVGEISAPISPKTKPGITTCVSPEKMVMIEMSTIMRLRDLLMMCMDLCSDNGVTPIGRFGFSNKEIHGDAPHNRKNHPTSVIQEHPLF